MNNNDNDYEEGHCPIPTFYAIEEEPVVIYDAEGNPLTQPKVKLGFDLS